MKKTLLMIFALLLFSVCAQAQADTAAASPKSAASVEAKPKKATFRANKQQITEAQKMLKAAETGKMDKDFRAAVKKYQAENGLSPTGTLNRATLEKMNIGLTDKQKEIPVSANSFKDSSDKPATASKRGPVFRANKEQVMAAQKMLKEKGMYAGEETGKLDDATREGLKKFQTANGAKVTGTLNRETLEKMGIALTDRQKEM
ncbi:MAG: putative peptidoglycan binding domain protein [Acidobacteria bacterium]|jgi:peptidoglycan hydrolase-like protein with peptidoglycan-binding domain|nr:putative peptidoglycan binding domain protein [Acidobacteriota bacterium]